ncbi:MAG TPA: sigma-70 family RNA polymerase sigma factor [Ktedonobacteraceae bacterium]|nr:sigma-70 family RNA polymerase sigma factor [Ktedonobacteraceae bacterium]
MEHSFSGEDRRDAQLEAIFRTHFADLYRYIYRQVHHTVIAEDLTSAVFLKALRWLQQDRSPESVKGWLYATARSIIADYWRENAQILLLPLEVAEEIPVLSDESDEQIHPHQARIQHLLDGLPSRDRQILTLRYFQGYSAAEIGQVLGLSTKHVRVLQLRALRRAALLEAEETRKAVERNIPMELPTMPFNEQALHVLKLAEEEARNLNHNYIGTEHLLLGILGEGSTAAELINMGMTVESTRGGIMFILGGRPQGNSGSQFGFTRRVQKVFFMAGEEAQRLGETAISPQHILIAMLREGQGIAAMLLQISGVRLQQEGEKARISIIPDEQGTITLPPDFQLTLEQHPAERSLFEKLSYTKQKIFVDRIERAEGEAARSQQIEKIIEQLHQILQVHQQNR